MYQPPHFREDSLDAQHGLIRAHPLGLLISAGAEGLVANPIPFTVYPHEGAFGTLRCHVSRANRQWQDLQTVEECLVVFQGPQAYITPSWYAAKAETGKVVPTWNYAVVQARGRPLVTDDAGWLRRQIADLTDANEQRFLEPWHVDDAPDDFVAGQLKGIVGIEIVIDRVEGKWKMSQNRTVEDRGRVAAGLKELGAPQAETGKIVERYLREDYEPEE